MRNKPTQKELCVRYLASRGIGTWVPGYDVVKNASQGNNIIQDADTRLYELIRDGGYYDSPNNRYFIEHRKNGKYAEFRISRKEPLKQVYIKGMSALKDWTYGSPYQLT